MCANHVGKHAQVGVDKDRAAGRRACGTPGSGQKVLTVRSRRLGGGAVRTPQHVINGTLSVSRYSEDASIDRDACVGTWEATVDEIALAVATTVATKGAEALVSAGRGAVAALTRLVRNRLRQAPDAAELGDAVEAGAVDANALASMLRRMMRQDPEFAEELRQLWGQASAQMSTGAGSSLNTFTGSGRNVVQARDIHGGVSF